MQEGYTALSEIDKFGDGALNERLTLAMEKVGGNIADTNTAAEAVRKIIIELSIKPNEDRSAAKVLLSVGTKLAAHEPVQIPVVVGRDENGQMVLAEKTKQLPGQYDIYGNECRPKVLPMNGGKQA